MNNGNATSGRALGFQLPATGSGTNVYWVGAYSYDSSALSNSGIRGTIQVLGTNVTGCLQFWVAEEMASNNVWGQVGYFLCDTNGKTPTAFYQVWKSGGVAAGGSTSVSTGSHQFSMYLESGTTWAYAIDGNVFGTVVMNSTSSSSTYPIEALSEEDYLSNPYNPPQVELSSIQTLKLSNWYSPINGYEPYGCGTTGLSCWDVAGNLQNSTIPADAIVVGGNTALVSSGTWLWQQSGTPDFTITASSVSETANANVTGTSKIKITPINGFSARVTLSVTTNSTNLSCTDYPTSFAGGSGNSTLSCKGLSGGNYIASVTAASNGVASKTATVVFYIQDFVISTSPASVNVDPSAAGLSSISFDPVDGFAGTIALSYAVSPPIGLTCNLTKTSVILGPSQTVVLSCSGRAGTYSVTLTGTSGSLSRHSVLGYTVIPSKSGGAIQTYFYELVVGTVVAALLGLVVTVRKRRGHAEGRVHPPRVEQFDLA